MKCEDKFLYDKQISIGSNIDFTAFYKKGFEGVATVERYSTVPFSKEVESLFIEDKDVFFNVLELLILVPKNSSIGYFICRWEKL